MFGELHTQLMQQDASNMIFPIDPVLEQIIQFYVKVTDANATYLQGPLTLTVGCTTCLINYVPAATDTKEDPVMFNEIGLFELPEMKI